MEGYVGSVWWVRLVLQRGFAAIYLFAFVAVLDQFRPLLGERGLLPVPRFLRRATFREAPTLFHVHCSDGFLTLVALAGVGLSVVALGGWSDSGPLWLSLSMLLEAGFFATFLDGAGFLCAEPSSAHPGERTLVGDYLAPTSLETLRRQLPD